MKHLLPFIILLLGYLLTNCSGQNKLSTHIPSDEIIPVTEKVQSKSLNDSTLTDIDGNVYPVVAIGNKLWMAGNLNVSKYNNGKTIVPYAGGGFLQTGVTGMYVLYENDKANGEKYGKLYNHYAIQEGCICPEGWHVPSEEDWHELIDTQYYQKLNLLLGGFMNPQEISPFSDLDNSGYWWTNSSLGRNTVASYEFHLDKPTLHKNSMNERNFLSVRCIKALRYEN